MIYPVEITFEVSQRHIDTGEHHNNRACPIAKAAVDAGYAEARILQVSAFVRKPDWGSDVLYRLSKEASAFVDSFDRKIAVQPFTFTASLVSSPTCMAQPIETSR